MADLKDFIPDKFIEHQSKYAIRNEYEQKLHVLWNMKFLMYCEKNLYKYSIKSPF